MTRTLQPRWHTPVVPFSASRPGLATLAPRSTVASSGTIAALAASVVLLALSRSFAGVESSPVPLVLDVLITFFTAVSLVRPRFGAIGVGMVLMVWVVQPQLTPTLTVMNLFIPVFVAGALGLRQLRLFLTVWYLGAALVPSALYWSTSVAERIQTASIFAVLMAITWALGRAFGRLSEEVVALDQARFAAVAAERRAIAQDLHDAVSSATTRIIMRAEQARLRGIPDPTLAADIEYILATGRQSAGDLRSLLTTLRADADGVRTAGWHIASLTAMVEASLGELRRAGFAVESTVRFDEAGLSSVDRDTLGKVVREATANIIKHAVPRSTCTFLLVEDDDGIEIVVANRRQGGGTSGRGSGLGLIGAAERVQALGGEFETNGTPHQWVLRARVPRAGAA